MSLDHYSGHFSINKQCFVKLLWNHIGKMKDCDPMIQVKWNECIHTGTIQDTERLVHKEWSDWFLPRTIPFSSFSCTYQFCCPRSMLLFKYYKAIDTPTSSRLSSFCSQKWKYFWVMPCCSCLSESFSSPSLSRAGLRPAAPSSFSPAAGKWSAAGWRGWAPGRHLEAPRGICSKFRISRWKKVSKFFVK